MTRLRRYFKQVDLGFLCTDLLPLSPERWLLVTILMVAPTAVDIDHGCVSQRNGAVEKRAAVAKVGISGKKEGTACPWIRRPFEKTHNTPTQRGNGTQRIHCKEAEAQRQKSIRNIGCVRGHDRTAVRCGRSAPLQYYWQ